MTMTERRMTLRAALLALPAAIVAAAATRNVAQAAPPPAPAKGPPAKEMADLQARQDISDILIRYARSNDRADEDLMRSCFHSDATFKFGPFDGAASDFVPYAMKIVRPLKWCAHHISNVFAEVKGDRAVSECYYFAHHRRVNKAGDGEEDAFFEGRYVDRHEKRDGVWKIAHRRGLGDYTTVVPAATAYESIPKERRSGRLGEDPLYVMLSDLRSGQ